MVGDKEVLEAKVMTEWLKDNPDSAFNGRATAPNWYVVMHAHSKDVDQLSKLLLLHTYVEASVRLARAGEPSGHLLLTIPHKGITLEEGSETVLLFPPGIVEAARAKVLENMPKPTGGMLN